MNKIKKLLQEIAGVRRVLGAADFMRWFGLLLGCSVQVLRKGSLGPVDDAYGSRVRFKTGGIWVVIEDGSLGVVREIVAAHCYVEPSNLAEAKTILDLGANCGVFTLFALANAPAARLVSVEAQPHMTAIARQNIASNGYADRVDLRNAYAGEKNDFIAGLIVANPELNAFNPFDYMDKVGVCDFLKCDIEGAEYSLITDKSTWLRKVRKISLEYHGTWEEGARLNKIITAHGFEVKQYPHGVLGYLMCRRLNEMESV
jgi:hypothetical protein